MQKYVRAEDGFVQKPSSRLLCILRMLLYAKHGTGDMFLQATATAGISCNALMSLTTYMNRRAGRERSVYSKQVHLIGHAVNAWRTRLQQLRRMMHNFEFSGIIVVLQRLHCCALSNMYKEPESP